MFLIKMDTSFWRPKSKQAGKAQLYCRITVDGKQLDIGSSGLTIRVDHWDGDRITHKDPEAPFKNEQIDNMRVQIRHIYAKLFSTREPIAAARIKRLYLKQSDTDSTTLLSAFQLYLEDSKKDRESDLTKATLGVYDNVRKKLTDFLISESSTDLLVGDFDLQWIKKFRQYMKQVPGHGRWWLLS